MTGALGDDSLALVLRKAMKDNGADSSRARSVKDKPTGVGVVLVETMIEENRNLINPGPNHDLQLVGFETLESLNGGGHGDYPQQAQSPDRANGVPEGDGAAGALDGERKWGDNAAEPSSSARVGAEDLQDGVASSGE